MLPNMFFVYVLIYEKKSLLEDVPWENKVHELYLNAEETDNSQLSEMLQYFRTADPTDQRFGALSDTVREQKGVKEEVTDMCKAVEYYAREREIHAILEIINNLLAEGFSLEKSLKLAGIDEETYRQYSDKK